MCNSDSVAAEHDSTEANSNTEAELMSSSGSEGLQRQLSASSGDGLSDKEDVLAAVKSQVSCTCSSCLLWTRNSDRPVSCQHEALAHVNRGTLYA